MLSAPDARLVRRHRDLPGLAVLLDSEAFTEILSQEVPHLGVTSVSIEYVRLKPSASCLCAFSASSAGGPIRLYAKAFRSERAEKLRHWSLGSASVGAGRPFRAVSERWQLGISIFPDDRRLKALGRLHEPTSRGLLLRALFPHVAHWPNGALETLRYKPERRYVARLATDAGPVAVLKMYDARGFAQARANAHLFTSAGSLAIARCLGESARFRVLAFEWLAGPALPDLFSEPNCEAVQLTGMALAELHGQESRGMISADEAANRSVMAAAASVGAVCPALGARARALAEWLARQIREDRGALCATHGDFYAEQVVVTRNGAAILDCDRASLGLPAADLGNFLAHLERAVIRGSRSRDHADAVQHALIEGYTRRAHAPTPQELRVHTAASLVRLAPEPFRRRESDWADRTRAILERAAQISHGSVAVGKPRRQAAASAPRTREAAQVEDPYGLASAQEWSFLQPALDPAHARGHLHAPLAALGAWAQHADLRQIRVTRYKPARRCMVEYAFECDAPAASASPFVVLGKARLKGVNRVAHQALESLWRAGFRPDRSAICVPQPLSALRQFRMTLQRKVHGTPAAEWLTGPDGPAVAARIADAIYTLHTQGTPLVRQHTLRDELRILRERLPAVSAHIRGGEPRIDRLLTACEQLAASVPQCAPHPVHRDFYPAHVLIDGERLWLLDLDLYRLGDPALDVGNFLAHLIEMRLRTEGTAGEVTATEAAFESQYLRLAGLRMVPAIRVYTTLSLVRHVHLSTLFPDRRHTTEALLDLCEDRVSVSV